MSRRKNMPDVLTDIGLQPAASHAASAAVVRRFLDQVNNNDSIAI